MSSNSVFVWSHFMLLMRHQQGQADVNCLNGSTHTYTILVWRIGVWNWDCAQLMWLKSRDFGMVVDDEFQYQSCITISYNLHKTFSVSSWWELLESWMGPDKHKLGVKHRCPELISCPADVTQGSKVGNLGWLMVMDNKFQYQSLPNHNLCYWWDISRVKGQGSSRCRCGCVLLEQVQTHT